jgi:hypothetical protein
MPIEAQPIAQTKATHGLGTSEVDKPEGSCGLIQRTPHGTIYPSSIQTKSIKIIGKAGNFVIARRITPLRRSSP